MSPLDLQLNKLGFDRIGRIDAVGRRSLWMRITDAGIELRAGREGDDEYVFIPDDNPAYRALRGCLEAARFAAEWEHPKGIALDTPEERAANGYTEET